MDDQFGGRTDDDLFYDDFEPVESAHVLIDHPPPQADPLEAPAKQDDVASTTTAPQEVAKPPSFRTPVQDIRKEEGSTLPPPKNLSHSRFAPKPAPVPAADETPAPPVTETKTEAPVPQDVVEPQKELSQGPPPNAPTAPREKVPRSQGQQRQGGKNQSNGNNGGTQPAAAAGNTSDPVARLGSGANPRQKLTDSELAAKMEKMKLLAAEKTRKFEKAEKDEKQHAQAYARGMEEARKRRLEDAEKRKRGEEAKKQMDNEREKNRERKLKAMGMKEGGWDEGKDAMAEEEKRTFRGANGGVRGARRGGYGGQAGEEPDVDRFLDDRYRGRGRGQPGRGGRGGRGGFEGSPNSPATGNSKQTQNVPKAEDFPSLPSDGKKTTNQPPKPVAELPLPPPSSGKWDDEMEALDEIKAQTS